MTEANTAPPAKPRKRISTTVKVLLILLALLFVAVTIAAFGAWRALHQVTPLDASAPATGAQVEVLTPNGATQSTPVFIPNANNTSASQAAITTSAASAVNARPPSTATATANVDTSQQGVPVLPINNAAKPVKPEKPASPAKPQNTLDHLF